MKERIKKLWVKALRSGEYEQGKSYLHRKDPDKERFCCLGVLCDIARKEGLELGIRAGMSESLSGLVEVVTYDEDSQFLPESVVEWAGLTTNEPGVTIDGEPSALVDLNDSWYSFKEIANLIEEVLIE